MKSLPLKYFAISLFQSGTEHVPSQPMLSLSTINPGLTVALAVINDWSQLLCVALQCQPYPLKLDGQPTVGAKVVHELIHALNASNQIRNDLFFRVFVQRLDGVIDGFAQDCRQATTHNIVSE